WNSVKNALAQSDTSENLTFKDFVQVDVLLGGTGSSNVEVLNAKRGNISTGAGNDTINLSVVSNEKTWVNTFNIDTGAGNDT
ncbi:rhizobiocin, partial [Rhizobium sp. BR5]